MWLLGVGAAWKGHSRRGRTSTEAFGGRAGHMVDRRVKGGGRKAKTEAEQPVQVTEVTGLELYAKVGFHS